MLASRAEAPVVRLLLALLAIPGVFSMTAPSCEVKEYCPGHEMNTFPTGDTVQKILNDLHNTFCGCKRIGGSINVLFPQVRADDISLSEDNFTFFNDVEEVGGIVTFFNVPPIDRLTLPQLILIRGNGVASGGAALTLENSTVDEFVLPNLVEISNGNVQLSNTTWCGYYTVNWDDILETGEVRLLPNDEDLNFAEELDMRCPSADRECGGCTSGHCWTPGDDTTCHTLTKIGCPPFCPGRCFAFGNSMHCCDSMCVAGCSGGTTESHCVACEKFNNNGTCVNSCPPKRSYDINLRQFVVNPDGRVAAGDQCLEECPPGLFDLDGSCVVSCPANHMVDSNTCVACIGPCPSGTECQGWSGTEAVTNDDIMEEFLNNECVIVNGHIRLNAITAECRGGSIFCNPSNVLTDIILERFRFVKVIRGQLQISLWNRSTYPSLPSVIDYFRNVEYIGSLNLTLDTVNTAGDALVISTSPGLERVDLSRLRSVRYGNVRVRSNPDLCYVGDFQTTTGSNSVYLTQTELILPNGTNFQSVEDCNAAGMTCNEECDQTSRCWGPEDTNCVACVSYRYPPLWRCVPNCDEYNETFPNDATKECEQCHEECVGCCNQGPFQCKACRNFRIVHDQAGASAVCHSGTECVATCPNDYYTDGMECKLCHDLCVGGCTGPGNFVGEGGCNACDFVNFRQNDTQISCVAQCPSGTYRHQLTEAIGPVPAGNGACHPCHELCETCFGPQNTECFTCKFAAVENTTGSATVTTCLTECPSDRYLADNNICRPCHEECDGCTGQGNKMCTRCKNLRVVVTQTPALTTYECLRTCPNSSYWIDRDDNNTCIPCHPLCATCVAPGNSNCTQCKAVQATPILLNQTILVDGVNRTLYTCEATLGLGGGDTGTVVNFPWWGALLLAIGLPFVIILVLVVIVYLLCRAWRNRLKDVTYEGKASIVDNPVYGTADDFVIEMEMLPQPKVPPNLAKITIIPEDSLQLEDVLGSGAFGIVYKGFWRPEGEEFEYTVAVKVLNENTAAEATSELLDEGVTMASMDHPYVVRLYGISMAKRMMLVSQFVPLGSLLDFLRKHKDRLNARNMLSFCHQIAEGMGYLEQNRMVHRDLAARNVLVQSANNVKITDFGLSKCLEVGESGYKAGQGKVPVRWLAPECLRTREFSHKSDVWAFGVTVWEILTFGARPYQDRKPQEMLKYLESGQRLTQPPTCTIDLYKVLLKCWLLDPNQRPPFNTLAVQFDSMCSDPLRYLSTMVDGQMDDYSALPCNDAEVVDKHVYEAPLDEDGYAMAFTEAGEYDNPEDEQGVAYLNPVPSVKANHGKEDLVKTIDDTTAANAYNYVMDTGVEGAKPNDYTYIDGMQVDGAKTEEGNEYNYIDDVAATKESQDNEYNYIDDATAAKDGQEPQLSRMEEYDEYPAWNAVHFNPMAN